MHCITVNFANPCANQSSKISLDFCLIILCTSIDIGDHYVLY